MITQIVNISALIILTIFLAAGFAAIFFTTFGTLIMLTGAFLYALMTGFAEVNGKTMLILLGLYLTGEAAENLTTIAGVKKFGASNAAIAGAVIGGMLGAALGAAFFGIGLVPGTFLGIFLGAFLAEFHRRRDITGSVRAGAGGVLGRVGSIVVKVLVAIVMIVILIARIV